MSSFLNTKEINTMVRSKVMVSINVLMCFSQFSRYLNYFNSDFDP